MMAAASSFAFACSEPVICEKKDLAALQKLNSLASTSPLNSLIQDIRIFHVRCSCPSARSSATISIGLCARKAVGRKKTHLASRGLLVLLPGLVALVAAGHFVDFFFFLVRRRDEDSWGPKRRSCVVEIGDWGGKRPRKALKAATFGRCSLVGWWGKGWIVGVGLEEGARVVTSHLPFSRVFSMAVHYFQYARVRCMRLPA